MTTEIVYLGRDNKNRLGFFQDRVPFDFSAASRMLVLFEGSNVFADSAVNPDWFDWSIGGGVIEFAFGGVVIPPGEYNATVIVYDATRPNGQILLHGDQPTAKRDEKIAFRFIDIG